MTEPNYVYVDVDYLKELEEKAKKVDYYKGMIDGIMMCKGEPMKTEDYCDICKRDMCEDCVADATNPYCVPSHYEIRHEPKDENSSEKPNNCEHITEDGVTCAKYPACDDCPDNPLSKVKGSERLLKGKDEPQKKYPTEWCEDCNLWREDNCMGVAQCKANMEAVMKIYEASKDEPQTERESE